MKAGASFKSTLVSGWLPKAVKSADLMALEMATDIHRFASILAPKDKGTLVKSGRIERIGAAAYNIVFGGSAGGFSVPYAKRRHYENKKNPQTLRYLERAGDSVKRSGASKYKRKV